MRSPSSSNHDHAASAFSTPPAQGSAMTAVGLPAMTKTSPRDPTICPTDDEAIVPKAALNKQSWEYVVKSGVAGGLAGCAVRLPLLQTTC
jgi:hypothetical protein